MEENARPDCIAAINIYRREHPLCPLVVCSRSNEYRAASTQERLRIQSAVEVQPLSSAQVEAVLLQTGKPFAALRAELNTNTELRELTSSPLWLNVLLLTFKNTLVQALPSQRSDLQQALFQRYVQRMVEQKGMGTENQKRYSLGITVRGLSWLAGQMRTHNQTTFTVELLQPDWLRKPDWLKYQWSVVLVVGPLFGSLFSLVFGLVGGLFFGLISGLFFSLFLGLVSGLQVDLSGKREPQIILAERITWSRKNARNSLLVSLTSGLIGGLSNGLHVGLIGGLFNGLQIGLGVGLIVGLLGGIFGDLTNEMSGVQFKDLFGSLFFGLTPSQSLEHQTLSPGEGVRRSLRNGLLVGLLATLLVALTSHSFFDLLFGLLLSLQFGLIGGLRPVIQHTLLRYWLWQTGSFPFRMVMFLEDACARHLLQRVGGSYRFVHRLLLDYFADLDDRASSVESDAAEPVAAGEQEV